MARGRLLRTKVREAYRVGKAAEKGRLKAQEEALKNKPLMVSLREHTERFLDKIDGDTAIKFIGIATIATVIEPTVRNLPAVIEHVGGFILNPFTEVARTIALFIVGEAEAAPLELGLSWLLSIGIACLLVLFGPEILHVVSGGLGGLVTLFFAA